MLRVVQGERLSLLTSDQGEPELRSFLRRQGIARRRIRRVLGPLAIAELPRGRELDRVLAGVRRTSFQELALVAASLLARRHRAPRPRPAPSTPTRSRVDLIDALRNSTRCCRTGCDQCWSPGAAGLALEEGKGVA